jgi:uncharacterized protein YegJ (DUF2314 family)
MRSSILLLVVGLMLASCADDRTAESPATNDPIVYAGPQDTAMNRAIDKARGTLGEFEAVLASHDTSKYNFAVKVALPHDGGTEHIWLAQPELEADSVVGTVESMPVYVKTVQAGQRVRIDRDVISDWMYMENGKLRGGYTMRVGLEQLPDKERDAHKKALGLE